MAMTLAELLAEAKRLDEAATFEGCEVVSWEEMADAHARIESFYAEHGPRLLAVAEAGAKMRKTLDVLEYTRTSPRLSADVAAFDAAASGEGRG